MRVLVVEDEPSVRKFLSDALVEAGYVVESAIDGPAGLSLALHPSYDVALLDIMLPGIDGISICREIRQHGIQTPVIFLSARSTTQDKIDGLDAGADDYLPKPFQVGELLARVRASIRRSGLRSTHLRVSGIELDPIRREVRMEEVLVNLSPTEFSLLHLLMQNEGRTVTRVTILDHVWRVIDVYVSSLRKKLGDLGGLIVTDRGVGYRIRTGGMKNEVSEG